MFNFLVSFLVSVFGIMIFFIYKLIRLDLGGFRGCRFEFYGF